MAAVNAVREIEKVEATLTKLSKELQLATALSKRHDAKASAATFNGYTDAEKADYAKWCALLKSHPSEIAKQQQLLAALTAARDAKAVFKTAAVGELGEDGVYYIDDEDAYDDLMYGGDDDDHGDGDEGWNKEEEDEMAAFATVTAQLKNMGFDPDNYAPAAATTASTAAAATASQQQPTGPLLPHEAKMRSGGDNDILKYAKLGDMESFRNEENIEGIDVLTFRDNIQRTCLHYAADGGSADLVKYLLEKGLSPNHADEKGLTPFAIAVILKRQPCVELMTDYLRNKEKSFVANSMLDAVAQSEAHIPQPPRFIMSKGAPALPPKRPHAFWGTHQGTAVDGIVPVDVSSPSFNTEGVLRFLSSPETAVANSYYAWLSPVHAGLMPNLPRNTFAIYTPNCDVISMSSLMAGATLLAGADRRRISNAVAMVGNVAIAPSYRKGGDAVTIMGLTRTALQGKGAQIAVFTTPVAGPAQVCPPVARVKWYRRTMNTIQLIDNTTPTIVKELYPDFAKYAATLRIDSHLRSLFKDTNQLTREWVNIKASGNDAAVAYAKAILKLMDGELAKAGSECHFLFDGVDELIDNLLMANEVYVVGTPEKVTDVVVLAARCSRDKTGETSFANAAIHVFSLFTSLKEEERLLEMTKIGGILMGAEVFYASNTHGISEDNFRVAMFDEQSAYGTNLFVMADNFISAIPKVEPKKVFLPFALL